ncbi:MAG: thioesterase family protein [Bacteroidota bacterium]|nr:thioesterase family protein [Bacteroidota bacterium]
METIFYPVKTDLRIDWSDLDSFGHVNNLSILRYAQSARVKYLEKVGLMQMHHDTKVGPILASCKCDFKKPLFYPGHAIVYSSIPFIKNTSFGFIHKITNSEDEIIAEAQDIIVVYDFNTDRKVQVPQVIRERIEKLEKRI